MAISTNQKSTIYRNLYESTGQRHPPLGQIPPTDETKMLMLIMMIQGYLFTSIHWMSTTQEIKSRAARDQHGMRVWDE